MFAIASTRIVGLVAVLCAAVVAPQALAATSSHSRLAPPDAVQGYDLSGFDLSGLSTIPTDGAQGNDPSGFDLTDLKNGRAALTAATHKSVKAATKAAAAKAAAIAALLRRSVDLDAAYRKLYPGAYRQAVQTSDKAAVWRFPAFCNGQSESEYDYVYSGC